MMKFDERFLYGIREMDEEHTELIQRAEALVEAYKNNTPELEIVRLLVFLKEYVHYHFEHEEALQKQYNYPDYEAHHAIHEEFKQDIESLYLEIKNNGLLATNRIRFNHLCFEWIIHHIGETDKDVAQHILKSQS